MLGYSVDDTISPTNQFDASSNCSSDEGLSDDTRKRKRGSYRCSRCGLPKKGHSCKEASEPVHVQFSHYDAEQKNFVPQEELIQHLQEENRQLRKANAAIMKENHDLQEQVKQLAWKLPKTPDSTSTPRDVFEYPTPNKRQKAYEYPDDGVYLERYHYPQVIPPPTNTTWAHSVAPQPPVPHYAHMPDHRTPAGISVNIQSSPWEMAVPHQASEVRQPPQSPRQQPPRLHPHADAPLPPSR